AGFGATSSCQPGKLPFSTGGQIAVDLLSMDHFPALNLQVINQEKGNFAGSRTWAQVARATRGGMALQVLPLESSASASVKLRMDDVPEGMAVIGYTGMENVENEVELVDGEVIVATSYEGSEGKGKECSSTRNTPRRILQRVLLSQLNCQ
ncbi:hypothetical protein ACH5RR_008528, partial [Cinchona calisaya]